MKIVYRLANAVGVQAPILEYTESAEKKTFNPVFACGAETASSQPVSGGGFEVDDTAHLPLVEALDKSPLVYRAGGATPDLKDPERTD